MPFDASHMKAWWTPAEIAEAALPDLPATKRAVNALAAREGWNADPARARRRLGRGGGYEYHVTLFPPRAQTALSRAGTAQGKGTAPVLCDRETAWARFDSLPATAQARARARLEAIDAVETLVRGGETRQRAAATLAQIHDVSPRSIWSWKSQVAGVRRDDRLAYLVPRHRIVERQVECAPCDPEAWDAFLADYLRLERPSLTSCYRRAAKICAAKGWTLPPERTLRRKLEREVPRPTLVLARDGREGLKRLYPPQVRDKSGLHALECVNADGHRWDVAVRWSDGTVGRPVMTAFQDVYSGRILSWNIDQTENRIAVMLALGEMVERFGIPDHCVLDNGRNFASKWLTGGTPTRYRFKVKADDPLGVLPQLGVQVHWTTPYSGQSKTIERAFRDLCGTVALDPRFAGAWLGNKPDAKPENYGSRAIPIEEFERVVAEGIAEHNSRPGRKSAICAGRSLLDAFEESYAAAPIRRATGEQRRLWLMGVEALTAHRDHGGLSFMENRFWAEFLTGLAGRRLAARFDPLRLHDGLHVYALDGRYIGHAPCVEKVGFLSLGDAQAHARARNQAARAERERLEALRRMSVIELASLMDGLGSDDEAPPPAPKVVRPVFGRGAAAAAAAPAEAIDRDETWEAWQRGIRLIHQQEED